MNETEKLRDRAYRAASYQQRRRYLSTDDIATAAGKAAADRIELVERQTVALERIADRLGEIVEPSVGALRIVAEPPIRVQAIG
jgi:hypothetical protein